PAASPAFDLDLFACECNRAQEELLDLRTNIAWKIARFLEGSQGRVPTRGSDDTVVDFRPALASALLDLDHAEHATGQNHTWIAWLIVQNHAIQRIAIIALRAWNEAPVEWTCDTEPQVARDCEQAKLRLGAQL